MRRRDFIKHSAFTAAAAGTGLLLKGCSKSKEYDTIISGGFVIDGSGAPGRDMDVAIKGDRVVAIEAGMDTGKAVTVIDARGKAVSPGFVDPHTHTTIQLLVNPKAESKIRQGVTTEIGGNCGGSWYPVADADFEEDRDSLKERFDLDLTWRDLPGFFQRLEETPSSMNYATLVGNGTIRNAVMGPYDRPATEDEMTRMKALMRECMEAGAVGLSSGLEYTPSGFADTHELIELSKIAAEYGGIYATHLRSEDAKLIEAVDEAIEIRRKSGAGLQISHFKAAYPANWDKIDTAIEHVAAAEKELGNVLCDRYSYHAFSTGLSMFFPLWAREGKSKDFVKRLKDPSLDSKIRSYVEERGKTIGTWDKVLLSSVKTDANKHVIGKTVLAAANEAGKSNYEFMRDLIIAEENNVSMIGFAMSEDNLKKVLAHPLVIIGSDGNSLAPYGPLSEGNPHPRSYGTFPRVLGRFVREEKIMSLETAVRKMSGLAADKFHIAGRGYLKPGSFADVVVFDPDTVIDKAEWASPHQYPVGIEHVLVNGVPAVSEGEHTGATSGRILRNGAQV